MPAQLGCCLWGHQVKPQTRRRQNPYDAGDCGSEPEEGGGADASYVQLSLLARERENLLFLVNTCQVAEMLVTSPLAVLPVWVPLLELLLSSGKVPFPAGCRLQANAFSLLGLFARAARLFAWRWLAFSSSSWRLLVYGCCCRHLGAALPTSPPIRHSQEPALPREMDVPSAWKSLVKGNVISPCMLFWYLGVFLTPPLSGKLCFQ